MYLPADHPQIGSARVALVVVALGRTERLVRCLRSLVAHQSSIPFSVVCVLNPLERATLDDDTAAAIDRQLDETGVRVLEPRMNLGWSGGLHAGRSAIDVELFAWMQDDMEVLPGWLDALVSAADANPQIAAFGSMRVDREGVVQLFNGGWAVPDDLRRWSSTDTTQQQRSTGLRRLDWVTSRGLLVRTRAWDEVGGTDPSLYPLTYVDLDFSTHLRAHGWGVALVCEATVWHAHNQSAPGLLREFLDERLTPRVQQRWSAVVAALPHGAAAAHAHACTRDRAENVEGWVALEATDIVVQFSRWVERWRSADQAGNEAVRSALDAVRMDAHGARAELADLRASRSWRITAPLRALRARRARRGSE